MAPLLFSTLAVVLCLVFVLQPSACRAFSVGKFGYRRRFPTRIFQSSTDDSQKDDGDDDKAADDDMTNNNNNNAAVYDCTLPPEVSEVERLKRQLFELGASFDRGFGANPRARQQAAYIIDALERYNPEKAASRGIDDGHGDNNNDNDDDGIAPPLQGSWRMIWTTASDVLVLSASPLSTVGAIHQVFELPNVVTNVIDFQPRAQALLPPDLVPNTLLRAKVKTRASSRRDKDTGDLLPNRVGLYFESVQLQPLEVLGMQIDVFPPLGFDLPKLPIPDSLLEGPDSPGYFDVVFLDAEVLVIRQNAPGGLFCFCKVDSIDS